MGNINAFSWNSEIDLMVLIINLLIGFGLGLALQFHFKRFGSVLSNRDEIAHILPIITLSVILIISIVKSSLALSLGLVGALSIVRFRTPIKEPEELAYLFLSIATGLGLGAGQRAATCVSFVIIMILATFIKHKKGIADSKHIHLFLNWNAKDTKGNKKTSTENVTDTLLAHASKVNLRRYEDQDGRFELHYVVDLKAANIAALTDDLHKVFGKVNITILDQNNIPKL